MFGIRERDDTVVVEMDVKEVVKLKRAIGAAAMAKVKLPLKRISVIGYKSVLRNFHVGGRPEKWAPLLWRDGSILQKSGRMKASVHPKVMEPDNVKIATRHKHARFHNYGTNLYGPRRAPKEYGPKEGKKWMYWLDGWGNEYYARRVVNPGVPARPFMLWQKEDADEIAKLVATHTLKQLAKRIGSGGMLGQ